MGFEPQTFRPIVRRANHCATGAGTLLSFSLSLSPSLQPPPPPRPPSPPPLPSHTIKTYIEGRKLRQCTAPKHSKLTSPESIFRLVSKDLRRTTLNHTALLTFRYQLYLTLFDHTRKWYVYTNNHTIVSHGDFLFTISVPVYRSIARNCPWSWRSVWFENWGIIGYLQKYVHGLFSSSIS